MVTTRVKHNTIVYQYLSCYTTSLYCTGTLRRIHIQLYGVDQSQEPGAEEPYHVHGSQDEEHRPLPRRTLRGEAGDEHADTHADQ